MDIEYVRSRFIKHFDGTTGAVYASPGRINLIGEHTDYNGGFVFPGAIDKGMIAEIKPNGTNTVKAYSIDLKDYVEFGLNEEDAPRASWARYIFGVCREMMKRGVDVKGFNTAFAGDVPLGAGMSSSAALESTYAYALNDLFGDNKIDKFELAKVGQSTEHNYCGVNCGIMDQFASVFGKKGSLIRLDCRSLEYQYFPFDPQGYRLVLVDSVVKHELASSAYNKRRQSCDFSQMVALVDELGGITVNVPESFSGGNGGGSLKAGTQTLNGEQTLVFTRERYKVQGGDFSRAQAQRIVLTAIINKILDQPVTKWPNLVRRFSKGLSTDMSVTDFLSIGQKFYGKSVTLNTAGCPSYAFEQNGVSYVGVEYEEWQDMMRRTDAGLGPKSTIDIPEPQASNKKLGAASNAESPKDYKELVNKSLNSNSVIGNE